MNTIPEIVHKRLLDLRNLETIVNLRDFQIICLTISVEERNKVLDFIACFDAKGLREWYKQQRLLQLQTLGVRELRLVASKEGVANYNLLTKAMLLSAIMRQRGYEQRPSNPVNPGPSPRNEGIDNCSGSTGGEVPFSSGSNGTGGNGSNGFAHVAAGNPPTGIRCCTESVGESKA